MDQYLIRDIYIDDYKQVTDIYNSNRQFLQEHLGAELIDEEFVSEEVLSMSKMGFHSCVIVDREKQMVQGILDYRFDKEVYLSLFMLTAVLQGKGNGHDIYACFESAMLRRGCDTIRIDVVKDCRGEVFSFWKSLGFLECENVVLQWGEKKREAVIMRKKIR